ncbi:MAG: ATP-binding cassette domain-containing protein [Calditrichaeota bacterium]|nr:MAG: ATP-binding cassette domain-containing protein [Calditrichota bacterium]
MSDKTVIELSNVYLKTDRGNDLFLDLNFSLKSGESAIIYGAAGSGKSVLVELLIGRRFVDSGAVEVFGKNVKKRKKRIIRSIRKKVGGVGGIFSLVPTFTVAENITYPLVLAGESKKVIKDRLMKMLTEFSLLKQASEYPDKLTRVEKMLVQFARANVAHQPLIIIDEPLAGLDHKTYDRIYEYMGKLALSGLSLFIVSSLELKSDLPKTRSFQLVNGVLV